MLALITGASSGIGASMARYLGSKGVDLILIARRKDVLLELKNELNVDVTIIDADLSKMSDVKRVFSETKDMDVDILINNAGFGLFGDFVNTDISREFEMIDVNIKAPHFLTKEFLKLFVERDRGYILNVASSAGFLAGPKLSTYYATKNYILRLSEAIYQEQKEKGSHVHISVLCPGPVKTEFNDVAKVKFNKIGMDPDDVAKYAIDNMFKEKLHIVPGFKTKLGLFFLRLTPTKLVLKLVSKFQESKNS